MLFKELIAFQQYKNSKMIIQQDRETKAISPDEYETWVEVNAKLMHS
jgi:hypothetical protein